MWERRRHTSGPYYESGEWHNLDTGMPAGVGWTCLRERGRYVRPTKKFSYSRRGGLRENPHLDPLPGKHTSGVFYFKRPQALSVIGYIKLYRIITEDPLWCKEPFTRGQAWVDMLLLANHKDDYIRIRGNRIEVKRGQLAWSEISLSARWAWSRGKVRRFLAELESKMEQKIVQQKTRVTSLITILNYEKYQGGGTTNGTTDGQQTVQQTDNRRYTDKNDKNEKNGKNTITPLPPKSKSGGNGKRKQPPPEREEVAEFFAANGYSREAGYRAYDYYADGNPPWHDSRGNPVKSWKQKMRAVWFKPENLAAQPAVRLSERTQHNIAVINEFLSRGDDE